MPEILDMLVCLHQSNLVHCVQLEVVINLVKQTLYVSDKRMLVP